MATPLENGEIEALMHGVGSASTTERSQAAARIAGQLPALLATLKNPEDVYATAAIAAGAQLGVDVSGALDILRERANDWVPLIFIMHHLGRGQVDEALAVFRRWKHRQTSLADRVALESHFAEMEPVRDFLVALLDHDTREVRYSAVRGCARVGWCSVDLSPAVGMLVLLMDDEEAPSGWDSVGDMTPIPLGLAVADPRSAGLALEWLGDALAHGSVPQMKRAAQALAIGYALSANWSELKELFKNRQGTMRAASALGLLRGVRAQPHERGTLELSPIRATLESMRHDRNAEVREVIVRLLEQLDVNAK